MCQEEPTALFEKTVIKDPGGRGPLHGCPPPIMHCPRGQRFGGLVGQVPLACAPLRSATADGNHRLHHNRYCQAWQDDYHGDDGQHLQWHFRARKNKAL